MFTGTIRRIVGSSIRLRFGGLSTRLKRMGEQSLVGLFSLNSVGCVKLKFESSTFYVGPRFVG